jgi:hypothetical protein
MEQATYGRVEDFEIASRNAPNYVVADLSWLQGGAGFFRLSSDGSFSTASLTFYGEPRAPFQALTENRPPLVTVGTRAEFKQRTFPGKPLSDDAVIHATRVASEIEDDSITRRLFGG